MRAKPLEFSGNVFAPLVLFSPGPKSSWGNRHGRACRGALSARPRALKLGATYLLESSRQEDVISNVIRPSRSVVPEVISRLYNVRRCLSCLSHHTALRFPHIEEGAAGPVCGRAFRELP
jgi:hypothetical protein